MSNALSTVWWLGWRVVTNPRVSFNSPRIISIIPTTIITSDYYASGHERALHEDQSSELINPFQKWNIRLFPLLQFNGCGFRGSSVLKALDSYRSSPGAQHDALNLIGLLHSLVLPPFGFQSRNYPSHVAPNSFTALEPTEERSVGPTLFTPNIHALWIRLCLWSLRLFCFAASGCANPQAL